MQKRRKKMAVGFVLIAVAFAAFAVKSAIELYFMSGSTPQPVPGQEQIRLAEGGLAVTRRELGLDDSEALQGSHTLADIPPELMFFQSIRTWQNADGGIKVSELGCFSSIDMGEADLDFELFQKIYKKLESPVKSRCLARLMFFDIVHPKLQFQRRGRIRKLFEDLVRLDTAIVPSLSSELAFYLTYKAVDLEHVFAYADILGKLEEPSSSPKLRELFLSYADYVLLHLRQNHDKDNFSVLLVAAKRWCGQQVIGKYHAEK